jgi:pyruvate dehydrogenase E2 component (dihydrolipoamide acetyltransferase)
VFLHGLGSHAEVWSAVAPALAAEGRRCLALDLPGHGLSSKGADFSYDLEGHAAWLEAAADALGEPEVHLVASSLGGLWAAAFAARFPRRIASLTLVGAVGLEPLAPERRRWTADYLGRMDRVSIADRLHRAVADSAAIDSSFIEETYRMNNSAGAAEAFARIGRYYLEHINEDVQLDRLTECGLGRKLLLLWGKDDATVAYSGAVAAARRLAGCTLYALDGTCHVPHLEQPAAVIWALSRHLRLERLPVGRIEGGEISRSGELQGPDHVL